MLTTVQSRYAGNSPTTAHVEGFMRTMTRTIRGALGAGAAGLCLVLVGCGAAAEPEPAETATTTAIEEAPSTGGSDMHTRLANALAQDAPLLSRQILAAGPRLEERELPEAITGWQVYEIIREDAPHIPSAVVAMNDQDQAMLLTGSPESFSTLTSGVTIADAEQAGALAASFLELTRDTSRLTYPVASFDDLRWTSQPNADEVAAKEQARQDLADQIQSPSVADGSDGWVVTSWSGDQDTIVRHETTVGRDGTVSDSTTVVAQGLPLQRTVG